MKYFEYDCNGKAIDVIDLLARVCKKLTGNPKLNFHFSEPPSYGALGSTTKDLSGELHIYIHPDVDVNAIYRITLHEAAHAKLHRIAPSTVNKLAPGTYQNQERLSNSAKYQAEETEAKALQTTWLTWADQNFKRALEARPEYSCLPLAVIKLIALAEYYNTKGQ